MKKVLVILSLLFVVAVSAFAVSCGAKAYSVSFDTDGGESIAAVKVEEGMEYTLPVPERNGYSFEGWYLTEDFSGDAVTVVTVTENLTVYAKWEKLSVITLELNGGTLEAGTTLYLKSGEVIYDFMQDYIPTKSGFEFGAWFDGDSELARNTRMPEAGITLTAEYKVGYSIQIWTQDISLTGYEKTGTVEDSDYVGTTVTPEETVTGFERVANDDEISSIVLTENAADNVLKLYYDRAEYTVRFVANYPDGSSATDYTVKARYGVAVELPYDYTFEGYFLSGWSTSANGAADYKLSYIDSIIYNKEEDSQAEADEFIAMRNSVLFAVWSKGYTDMFGGNDYIFLFEEDAASVYLCRGDVYFKGDYDAASRQFNFIDTLNDNLMILGRLNEDGTFSYYNDDRGNASATLYVVGEGLIDSTRIFFDEYNGLTYTVQGESGLNSNSKGTYVIDETGFYHVTFTDGDLAGQKLVMSVGSITVDNVSRPAFMVRNEEQVALGTLVRFAISEGQMVYYKPEYYGITLNGFNTAVMNVGDQTSSYSYVMNEDGTEITLLNAYGMTAGVARIMESGGQKGYMLYQSAYDTTYTGANGGTLVLDGLYNATYTNGGVSEKGYFSLVGSSVFGGMLVNFTANGTTRLFLVNTEKTGSGDTETKVSTYVEKPLGYGEYQYMDEGSIYYAPLIVVDDKKEGWASLYGYDTETGEYVFVSEGEYTYDAEKGLYTLTVVGEPADVEITGGIVDVTKVKSVVFAVTVTTASNDNMYSVNYWYSAVIETEEGTDVNEDYADIYTCENISGGKLTLVGGYAILEQEGHVYSGVYAASKDNANLISIAVESGGTVAGYLYVEIDPEAMTYYSLSTAPYTAKGLLTDGTISSAETMAFDGKGNAVYTSGETQYTGTFAENGTTSFGLPVYTFTAEGMQFNFVQIATNDAVYFAKYNESIGADTYVSEKAGILELDGYGFQARYTDLNGTKYAGLYFITSDEVSDHVIVLYTENGYFYFDYEGEDLTDFTVRGTEYSTYLLLNNQAMGDIYIRLDGYGTAAVFTPGEGEGEYNYIDEAGSYTMNADGTVSVTYKSDASTERTIIGALRVYSVSSTSKINVFVVRYEEFVRTYVNKSDWSILILDGYGNVTRYDAEGKAESGAYTVITDDLLYFANAAGTDASLYTYSNAEGTIEPINLNEYAYYTKDLESLLFTSYGFAVFNGETRYYYNVEDGKVTIYLQDPAASGANEYGFVSDSTSIPSFTETFVYEGKTYYKNDGFRLTFDRVADTASLYPVLVSVDEDGTEHKEALKSLYFTPSGGTEFSVNGTLFIGDDTYNCVVVREKTEDGYEMYIKLPTASNLAYYRFDITVNYQGSQSASEYEITGMRLESTLPSNNYLSMYYLVYLFYGSATANAFENSMGEISLITDYNEAGEAGEPYLNFWFGEGSGIYDVNGELFKLEKVPYESKGNNMYSASFTGTDGYEYELLFVASYNSYMSTYGYQLLALVRMQELTDAESGLTVKVGRIVGSEAYQAGSLFSVQIVKDGETLQADWTGYIGEDIYVVTRTREATQDETEGKILSSTYYKVVLTEDKGESVGETNEKVIPVYASVTVTEESANTYYTADNGSYVDILAESNTVKLLVIGTKTYGITESVYDEQTQTYTVTTAAGVKYTIRIAESVAEVTEVPAAEEGQQA